MKNPCGRIYVGLATLSALVFVRVIRAEDWPQFRGPNRDSVWRENGILTSFPAKGLNVRWRAGSSYCDHPTDRHEVAIARSPFALVETYRLRSQRRRTVEQVIGYCFSTTHYGAIDALPEIVPKTAVQIRLIVDGAGVHDGCTNELYQSSQVIVAP